MSNRSDIRLPKSANPGALIFPSGFLPLAGLVDCAPSSSETISSTVRTDNPSATIRAANFSIAAASLRPSNARAWPAEITPAATRR